MPEQESLHPSHSTYSPWVLRAYDAWVHGVSNRCFWRCSTDRILGLYDENVGARHLDVGVGTGYFLDRCSFPVRSPDLHLLDLNPHCVEWVRRRVDRYSATCHRSDVLEPLQTLRAAGLFDSILPDPDFPRSVERPKWGIRFRDGAGSDQGRPTPPG